MHQSEQIEEIRQFAAFSDYKFIASVSFLSSGIPFTCKQMRIYTIHQRQMMLQQY